MPLLCLTIDLDSLTEYAAIHGHRLDAEDPLLMYRGPLNRFAQWCRQLNARGTIFAIGRDLVGPASSTLHQLSEEGFEIACHSYAHHYDLSRRQPGFIASDLQRALQVFRSELGIKPKGFRAPGYHLSSALLEEIRRLGFFYDSSALPSPSYWLIKLLALGAYRVANRPSASLLGPLGNTFGPDQPYHPDHNPYKVGSQRIWELPVTVSTPLRLPVTGAALCLLPRLVREWVGRSLQKASVVVINFHGMDFVDPQVEHVPTWLSKRQPELTIPIHRRLELFSEFIGALPQHVAVTCSEAISRLEQMPTPL